jgi:mannonate dehydratase
MVEMKVSLRLRTLSNEELTFVKQIGVDYVDVGPPILGQVPSGTLPGFQVNRLDLEKVQKVIKRIQAADLDIACFVDYPPTRQALLGTLKGERQLEDICSFITLLGAESIPVTQLCLEMVRHGPIGVPGRYLKKHRGGYEMSAFSLEHMRRELAKRELNTQWAHHFIDRITPKEYFDRCVQICERVVPVAEEAGVQLALHTDDPPVPDREGLLPGITTPLQIKRLFDAVPSKNLGLLFCCGTRYESGVDVYKQIRMLGRMKKIFHVHLRNVRGTLLSEEKYEEVSIDERDMDIFRVVKTLKEVDYEGAIYPDHVPILIDDPDRRAAFAFAIGYIKALLSAAY